MTGTADACSTDPFVVPAVDYKAREGHFPFNYLTKLPKVKFPFFFWTFKEIVHVVYALILPCAVRTASVRGEDSGWVLMDCDRPLPGATVCGVVQFIALSPSERAA